jgi:hypothetical protein
MLPDMIDLLCIGGIGCLSGMVSPVIAIPFALVALGQYLARRSDWFQQQTSGPLRRLVPPGERQTQPGPPAGSTWIDVLHDGTPAPEPAATPALPVQEASLTEAQAVRHLPRQLAFATLIFPTSRTAIPLGMDETGQMHWLDLAADQPGASLHIGVYAQSGVGKDTLLRGWFIALAQRNAPDAVQFAVLDGKGDWLTPNLAHLEHMLFSPAGGYGNEEAMHAAIQRIDGEARRRQAIITQAGCRSREQYQQQTGQAMPLLVVLATDVMDSLADRVEELLIRLVSKARSLGIRVWVSMQTPTGKDTKWRINLSTVVAGNLQAGSQDQPALGIDVKEMRYRPSRLPDPQERRGVFVVRQGTRQMLVQAPYLSEAQFDTWVGSLPLGDLRSGEPETGESAAPGRTPEQPEQNSSPPAEQNAPDLLGILMEHYPPDRDALARAWLRAGMSQRKVADHLRAKGFTVDTNHISELAKALKEEQV